jgi:beta-glucosidase/6-phospho-beta-glucosidase/beta-galactosidase
MTRVSAHAFPDGFTRATATAAHQFEGGNTKALQGVLDVIAEKIDVRRYTYWSLLDNFQWAFGYRPRFALVSVDRSMLARLPKPSAAWHSSIVAANALHQ